MGVKKIICDEDCEDCLLNSGLCAELSGTTACEWIKIWNEDVEQSVVFEVVSE